MNNLRGEPSNQPEETTSRQRDLEWVRRLKAGDLSALEEMVKEYQDRIYRLAQGLLRDPEEALDVTQEAFLRVHQNIGRFAEKSAFYTWLYRIVVNLCHDARRRAQRRRKEFSLDQYNEERERDGEAALEIADPQGVDPRDRGADEELEARVVEAMESLPEKHRTALLLREVENMSYEEIASATGVSIGTVMSRLFYARKKMQELLGPYLDESWGARS
ncbi:MAG: sigma-70 family RNA polymerase sigma factor [Candidatus Omnitrophica bacterium]|nr:ECF RNA polymerase sigma-E factor [bacterium]NUN94697.1 sigma-70 family RNA polymerase sigma factor [Candidatus Omnitrophota bacterium]